MGYDLDTIAATVSSDSSIDHNITIRSLPSAHAILLSMKRYEARLKIR
jgi:hypothetical protein